MPDETQRFLDRLRARMRAGEQRGGQFELLPESIVRLLKGEARDPTGLGEEFDRIRELLGRQESSDVRQLRQVLKLILQTFRSETLGSELQAKLHDTETEDHWRTLTITLSRPSGWFGPAGVPLREVLSILIIIDDLYALLAALYYRRYFIWLFTIDVEAVPVLDDDHTLLLGHISHRSSLEISAKGLPEAIEAAAELLTPGGWYRAHKRGIEGGKREEYKTAEAAEKSEQERIKTRMLAVEEFQKKTEALSQLVRLSEHLPAETKGAYIRRVLSLMEGLIENPLVIEQVALTGLPTAQRGESETT